MASRAQYRALRKVGTLAVAAGQFATIDLPRDYDYESLFFRVAGNINVTTAYTAVRSEAPVQIVPRIEIIADGKNTLFSAPLWFATQASFGRNSTEFSSGIVTPPSGFAIANYAVEATGVVDFASIDCVRPKDSNFRPANLSIFQARLTFGSPGDCFTGAGVSTFSNMVVEIFAQQLVELPDTTGTISSPGFVKKTSYQEIAMPTSNTNQEIRLPAGNSIKSVTIRAEGSGVAGEPSNAVLNNLMLSAGMDVRLNLSGAQVRALNRSNYGLVPTGYYVADLSRNASASQFLSELWDVGRINEPKATVDVTGGANVKAQFVVVEYLPIA